MTDTVRDQRALDVTAPEDETRSLPIQVEISGWDEGVSVVAADAGPGAVRGAVEAALRRSGMTTTPR